MNTDFEREGIRYSLLVQGQSLRDREQAAVDLKPDPTLWTSGQKRKHGLKGPGRLMGYLDDEAEIRKHHKRAGQERSTHYQKPRAIEFTDRVEFR